jgi:hypothetical protein
LIFGRHKIGCSDNHKPVPFKREIKVVQGSCQQASLTPNL